MKEINQDAKTAIKQHLDDVFGDEKSDYNDRQYISKRVGDVDDFIFEDYKSYPSEK